MKIQTLLIAIFLPATVLAEDLTTVSGKKYTGVTISRVEADGLAISHDDGLAKVPFSDLSEELRKKYGYDPEKAATQAKLQADAAAAAKKAQRAQAGLTISPPRKNGFRIEHESYGKLLAEAKTKAANLNYSEQRTKEFISHISSGGMLVAHIERSTIGAANTKYFTVIVFDRNGREILRRSGDDDIPEIPGSNRMWWNIMTVGLPDIAETPIKIRIVDTLSNTASDFDAQ